HHSLQPGDQASLPAARMRAQLSGADQAIYPRRSSPHIRRNEVMSMAIQESRPVVTADGQTVVEGHPIVRRKVHFDWSTTAPHWVPDDPFTSHVINVLHLLLPAGERWFIDVVNKA